MVLLSTHTEGNPQLPVWRVSRVWVLPAVCVQIPSGKELQLPGVRAGAWGVPAAAPCSSPCLCSHNCRVCENSCCFLSAHSKHFSLCKERKGGILEKSWEQEQRFPMMEPCEWTAFCCLLRQPDIKMPFFLSSLCCAGALTTLLFFPERVAKLHAKHACKSCYAQQITQQCKVWPF